MGCCLEVYQPAHCPEFTPKSSPVEVCINYSATHWPFPCFPLFSAGTSILVKALPSLVPIKNNGIFATDLEVNVLKVILHSEFIWVKVDCDIQSKIASFQNKKYSFTQGQLGKNV